MLVYNQQEKEARFSPRFILNGKQSIFFFYICNLHHRRMHAQFRAKIMSWPLAMEKMYTYIIYRAFHVSSKLPIEKSGWNRLLFCVSALSTRNVQREHRVMCLGVFYCIDSNFGAYNCICTSAQTYNMNKLCVIILFSHRFEIRLPWCTISVVVCLIF